MADFGRMKRLQGLDELLCVEVEDRRGQGTTLFKIVEQSPVRRKLIRDAENFFAVCFCNKIVKRGGHEVTVDSFCELELVKHLFLLKTLDRLFEEFKRDVFAASFCLPNFSCGARAKLFEQTEASFKILFFIRFDVEFHSFCEDVDDF